MSFPLDLHSAAVFDSQMTCCMPHPCRAPTVPFWKSILKATARHSTGACELAFNVMATSRVHVPHGPLPRLHSVTSLLLNTGSTSLHILVSKTF